ncbi:MAG: type II toxin-antitoxin system HicB family antitoxin [Candidatus Marsarchaeota archaeon]|nr:type II toxin-antitoxin system HicB family antitoxin [Candidatus Marsarchaeota archaeon]
MELQTNIWKEGKWYVIKEAMTGVTTQGKTIEEAIKNIKEAVGLYLDEMPNVKKDLKSAKKIGAISVEIA